MPVPTIEQLLTLPGYFGLESATPIQRAWCRVADGFSLGELATDPMVAASMARDTPIDVWRSLCWGDEGARAAAARSVDRSGVEAWEALPRERPGSVFLVSAVRCGKTLFSTAATYRNLCLADLSVATTPGELPRASFVSLTTDLSKVAFQKLVAIISASRELASCIVTEPTNNRVVLRRPDGEYIEVRVVAADNAGASLTARWVASMLFDEAPKMGGSECDVDFNALVAAADERLLPNVQMLAIGSPWAAIGPVYETVRRCAGKPSPACVVFQAPGPALNPRYWSRERCAKFEAGAREKNATAFAEASLWSRFIADADVILIPPAHVDAARRSAPDVLDPSKCKGWPAVATIDPATRGNAWTVTVFVREPVTQRLRMALARQWRGSSETPLVVADVMREIGALVRPYGCTMLYTDQWASDAMRTDARNAGLELVVNGAAKSNWDLYDAVRVALLPGPGRIELVPDATVAEDLKRIRRVLTRTGVTPFLPTTPDGRHCDYAPAVALAIANPPPLVPAVVALAPCPDDRDDSGTPDDHLDIGLDFESLDSREGAQRWRDSVMRG